jgi:glycosyltransferase involved in cell wall biosynthesis
MAERGRVGGLRRILSDQGGRPDAPKHGSVEGRRVTILNWRDTTHPRAGGAETFCHEVAVGLKAAGAEVELLTARAKGQLRRELVDGILTLRCGGTFTVYGAVLTRLVFRRLFRRGSLDLILDCQNGIPFFSPAVLGRRATIVGVIFHVHQEQFALHFSARVARIGRWLEGPVSRHVYGARPVLVISPSTRAAVRRRLGLRGPLYVVPCGAAFPQGSLAAGKLGAPARSEASPTGRVDRPRIVCVGRLVPHKRVELLLHSLPEVLASQPDLDIHLVGSGPSRPELERLCAVLGLAARVTFHGWLPVEQRDDLMATAWLTVNTSVGEGWGLSVIEANALGVPAVCLDVDGLRDSVVEGRTGWVARSAHELPVTISLALSRLACTETAVAYRDRATEWARTFSWARTSGVVASLLASASYRQRLKADRRCRSDLALRVHFELPPGSGVPEAARLTDRWLMTDGCLTGLLYGVDEGELDRVVHRLELPAPVGVRVARSHDLLLPPPAVLATGRAAASRPGLAVRSASASAEDGGPWS